MKKKKEQEYFIKILYFQMYHSYFMKFVVRQYARYLSVEISDF